MAMLLNRAGNPLVIALLRSPLHGLLSRGVALVTVVGRRSGRPHTLPVQFAARADGVYLLSWPDRRWWRNLEGGGPVTLRIRGRTLAGEAEVLTGDEAEAAKAVFMGTSLERAVRTRPDGIVVRVSDLQPRGGSLP